MASGGSTGRGGSGESRSFDFGSDDVLCAYDDFASNEAAARRPETAVKHDFHEGRTGRPLYGQQQEGYHKEDVIAAVDRCMKKYADNLLLFLEGISGRLSQLELYCYKLERSIGDLRSDMVRDQSEKELQLKSLEKHLQEVHRSVQILRDKQELAETQKELAKFQVVPKEPIPSQKSNEGAASSEPKRHDETTDIPNQHLALVPRQTSAPPPLPVMTSEQNQPYKEQQMQQSAPAPAPVNMPQGHYILNQAGSYYVQHMPSSQDQQSQPLQQSQTLQQYVQPRPQFQDQAPPQPQAFIQYPQQWSQPPPQQAVQQHQQPSSQPQARPQTPPTYPPYQTQPPINPVAEAYQGSMPMQVPYSTIPQSGGSRADVVSYVYGGPGSTPPQPPQQQRQPQPHGSQSAPGTPLNKSGYTGDVAYLPQPNLQGYNMVYSSMDGVRGGPSQNIQPGSYPPSNMPALQSQHIPPGNPAGQLQVRPQPVRNQSLMEMVDKAVSMGYSREHAFSVMQRMAETGQPFDFNHLLDRLNNAGAAPRGWSG